MRLKRLFLGVMLLVGITGAGATNAAPEDISASISLKVPGNDAKQYPLALQKMQDGMYSCRASEKLPLDIIRQVVDKDGKQRITVTLKALENVYFNYGEQIKTVTSIRTASSTCRASGIAATCVRRRRLLLSTHRTVGWCVRTV